MNRHFYISDNLDELEKIESELEAGGINTEQIHLLSEQDAAVEKRQLHDVNSLMKKDLVHSGGLGGLFGLGLAVLVLATAFLSGWAATPVGWMPFVFLALVAFGFSVWEGGLYGLQRPNVHFRKFQDALRQGKHLLFVDVAAKQEAALARVVLRHPQLELAGTGSATPGWVVALQHGWHRFRQLV
jgi:hypothetical protein